MIPRLLPAFPAISKSRHQKPLQMAGQNETG